MHLGEVVLSGDRKSYGVLDNAEISVKVDLHSIDQGFTYRDKVRGFSVSPLLDDNLRVKYDDGREEVRKLSLTNSRGKEFEVLLQEDRNIKVRRSDGRVGTLSFDKSDNQIYFTYAEPGKHKGAAAVYREEPLVADTFTKDVLAARLMVSSLLPAKVDK